MYIQQCTFVNHIWNTKLAKSSSAEGAVFAMSVIFAQNYIQYAAIYYVSLFLVQITINNSTEELCLKIYCVS